MSTPLLPESGPDVRRRAALVVAEHSIDALDLRFLLASLGLEYGPHIPATPISERRSHAE